MMSSTLHILRLISRRILRLVQLALSTAKIGTLSLWPVVRFLSSIYHRKNLHADDKKANIGGSGYDSVECRNPKACGKKEKEASVSSSCHSNFPGVPPLGIPPLTVSFVPPSLVQAVNTISSISDEPETDARSITTLEIEERYGKDELIIKTTSPNNLCRYDRKIKVPERHSEWHIVPLAMRDSFTRKHSPPLGWKSYTHPEGLLYHRGKIDDFTFLADADVCDKLVGYRVQTAARLLIDKLKEFRHGYRKDLEIVLDAKDTQGTLWTYYIVDHTSKHLFWLDIHVIETYIYKGAESEAHVGRLLRSEYYQHLTYFPHEQTVDDEFFDEMRGMLIWGLTDSLTSLDSLTPYDEATMDRFLTLIKNMQDIGNSKSEYCVAAGARLRTVFENAQFNNFSGFPCARLTRTQSVRGEGREEPSAVFRLVSFFFFNVPANYLRALDGVYMDDVVFQAPFKVFVTKVTSGWQLDVVNAAVLFTANIAYLAIPTLLPMTGEINAAAAASFVSIILSLSSVIFGQLLDKRLDILSEAPTYDVASYFALWWSPKRGLSKLALMYSLPYVMMIWGAIAFILAVFLFAFKELKANAQILVMAAFVFGSLILCSWIVFQINSRDKLFYYPITFSSYLKKKMLLEDLEDEKSIGNTPNVIRRKLLKLGAVVKGVGNMLVLRRTVVKQVRKDSGKDKGKGKEQNRESERDAQVQATV